MNKFDHILVMFSVIVGLGVTHMLQGVGAIIEIGSFNCFYLPHVIWCVVTFTLLIQSWWAITKFKDVATEKWGYFNYFLILLFAIFLCLASALIIRKRPPKTLYQSKRI